MQSTRAGIRERFVQYADVREPELPSCGKGSVKLWEQESMKSTQVECKTDSRHSAFDVWGADEKMKMCAASEGMEKRQHRPAAACISGKGWEVGTAGVKRVPECRLGA